jgi:hypothetical protein
MDPNDLVEVILLGLPGDGGGDEDGGKRRDDAEQQRQQKLDEDAAHRPVLPG